MCDNDGQFYEDMKDKHKLNLFRRREGKRKKRMTFECF